MLPLEKALVESLFQDNLLRVVFATETLAAGMSPSYHPSPRRPSPQASTCPHHTSLMFPSYHPSPRHGRYQHARALHGRLGALQAW